MKTVLVVGAQGVLGSLTVEEFRVQGWRVLRAGRREEGANDFRHIDLDRPETLVTACEGVDLVVSAVEDPDCRLQRFVLSRGGVLLTMATILGADRDRLEATVSNPKGTVIFGIGYSGLTAVAVKDLISRHPESDAVACAYTISLMGTVGRGGALFGHRLLSGSSRRPTRPIDFGGPIGRRMCLEVDSSADRLIDPSVLEKRTSTFYLTVSERWVFRILVGFDRLGLLRHVPASWIRPRPPRPPVLENVSTEPMMTWLGVSCGGELKDRTTLLANGDYLTTAKIAPAIAGLLGEAAPPPGVFTIDRWFDWERFLPVLADMGITQVES